MPNRTWDEMDESERQAFYQELDAKSAQPGEAMIKHFADKGISMYGSHPDHLGEVLERTPDRRHFIVRRENDVFIRVREVNIHG